MVMMIMMSMISMMNMMIMVKMMNMMIMVITWLALWKASKFPAMMGMGRERTRTPDNSSSQNF